MSKKIVLDAGHGVNTAGKRTPNGAVGIVREWTMNNAVCNNIAELLKDYEVEIIRADDVTGVTDRAVKTRTDAINRIKPDLFVSVHHNAFEGVFGNATGVEAYSHASKPKRDADLAKLFTDEMAKLTGLRNRGAKQANFHMVRETLQTIPSVLCEGGFMDGVNDYPVITSAKGQRAYAQAVANICISYLQLKPKKTGPSVTIELWINTNAARVNGRNVTLEQPPVIQNGRTLTPARFVAEALGATVEWDEKSRKVTITR
jgi:N-acetylmuramoyl-L-alanine amidase